jgi:hypothetical protein
MANETNARSETRTVYAITERGERSFWTKIGVAFPTRDGSLNVQLDALPVSGRLQIRSDEPRDGGERR